MQFTFEEVKPLLTTPLSRPKEPVAKAWVAAINIAITNRYGTRLDSSKELVLVYVSDAISRRLAKRAQLADYEAAGPFNVRWNAASTTGKWFLPGEIEEMDAAANQGSVRSVRTPAPDSIRFSNRTPNPILTSPSFQLAGITDDQDEED